MGRQGIVARTLRRISPTRLRNLSQPGYYADGGNLYFRVARGGTKGWIFRFAMHGKTRDMGLGSYPVVGLAKARDLAERCRQLVASGTDPITHRDAQRAAARVDAAKVMTFDECRAAYVAAHEAGWRNAKHRQQWTNTLKTYASPVFGNLPVHLIDTGLVLRAIEPIWITKPETAGRLRSRIESILDWAKVRQLRSGENPARWRGHLDHLLPAKSKVRKIRRHAALPYTDISRFMEDLRSCAGIAARATEIVILCAARTGDIIGNDRNDKPPMKWSHVDLRERVWTIPSTKTDTEHRVPLSDAAVGLLKEMRALGLGEIIFPGMKVGQPLSNTSMSNVVKRMNKGRAARGLGPYVDPRQGNRNITVHGFRSTFRDWAAERTNFSREVAEAALAHAIDDKVEAAYRRGDLFEKRRALMNAWAVYCSKAEADDSSVVSIRRRVTGAA